MRMINDQEATLYRHTKPAYTITRPSQSLQKQQAMGYRALELVISSANGLTDVNSITMKPYARSFHLR